MTADVCFFCRQLFMSQGDTLETVKMSGAWVWMLNYFIRVYPPRYAPHPWFCLDLFEAAADSFFSVLCKYIIRGNDESKPPGPRPYWRPLSLTSKKLYFFLLFLLEAFRGLIFCRSCCSTLL